MPGVIVTPFPTTPAEGDAIEVAPGVLWTRLPLPMALDHVNIYALEDEDGWTVVDTGFDSRRGRAIWQQLRDGPLAGRPIRRVIGTHHHPDHIGLAGWLMAQDGADLLISRTAWLMARMLVLDEQDRPSEQALRFWRRAGMPPEILASRASERPFNFADVVHPLPLGFTRLTEGQEIRFGNRRWRVVMGHGHAPCHATFWSLDDDLVIGGDQLLPSISPNLGVYPTEPEANPVAEWLDSCQRMLDLAQPRHLVLPGHKLPFTGLPTRLRQLIDNHHGALQRLEKALSDAPRSAVGCFDVLFKRQIGDGEIGLALVEAVAHINYLRQKGVVTAVGESDGAVLWGA
ncbi:MBL fold metallo-hydrolase [Paracoccus fistulariae]|uniref:MBL fold metallo-hydrolase n=1 Tax=Paracoccus fistulariae TaxID=658446 RepID=A0ABY7SQC1_9RHOB|nr:MBL fold metallo-hydrolase [Paracoccus fistulariae]MDB6182180.1 MBL fold metallo-hydrolase [Paracoccus fistulariae]WCR09085.1 MBL fold metallo-hydrolase [Paracoccus fistulariae]